MPSPPDGNIGGLFNVGCAILNRTLRPYSLRKRPETFIFGVDTGIFKKTDPGKPAIAHCDGNNKDMGAE
ncbi:MAG: hypothetical protein ABIR56_05200 [Polaromonas sp.]